MTAKPAIAFEPTTCRGQVLERTCNEGLTYIRLTEALKTVVPAASLLSAASLPIKDVVDAERYDVTQIGGNTPVIALPDLIEILFKSPVVN